MKIKIRKKTNAEIVSNRNKKIEIKLITDSLRELIELRNSSSNLTDEQKIQLNWIIKDMTKLYVSIIDR